MRGPPLLSRRALEEQLEAANLRAQEATELAASYKKELECANQRNAILEEQVLRLRQAAPGAGAAATAQHHPDDHLLNDQDEVVVEADPREIMELESPDPNRAFREEVQGCLKQKGETAWTCAGVSLTKEAIERVMDASGKTGLFCGAAMMAGCQLVVQAVKEDKKDRLAYALDYLQLGKWMPKTTGEVGDCGALSLELRMGLVLLPAHIKLSDSEGHWVLGVSIKQGSKWRAWHYDPLAKGYSKSLRDLVHAALCVQRNLVTHEIDLAKKPLLAPPQAKEDDCGLMVLEVARRVAFGGLTALILQERRELVSNQTLKCTR